MGHDHSWSETEGQSRTWRSKVNVKFLPMRDRPFSRGFALRYDREVLRVYVNGNAVGLTSIESSGQITLGQNTQLSVLVAVLLIFGIRGRFVIVH